MRLNETEEEFDARIEEYVEIEEQEAGLINAIEEEEMKKTTSNLFFIVPYFLWIVLFVLAPVAMIIWNSSLILEGVIHLRNYWTYFAFRLDLFKNEFQFDFLRGNCNLITLLVSYPTAFS